MMTKYEWLRTMRDGGAVQRYHTTRMIRSQNVAAHSWGVAVILLAVGVDNPAVLACALLHDNAELDTGDVPANAKWRNPQLEDALAVVERRFEEEHGIHATYQLLTEAERKLLQWADIFELCLWCREDVLMGNRWAQVILQRGIDVLMNREDDLRRLLPAKQLKDLDALSQTFIQEVELWNS